MLGPNHCRITDAAVDVIVGAVNLSRLCFLAFLLHLWLRSRCNPLTISRHFFLLPLVCDGVEHQRIPLVDTLTD